MSNKVTLNFGLKTSVIFIIVLSFSRKLLFRKPKGTNLPSFIKIRILHAKKDQHNGIIKQKLGELFTYLRYFYNKKST
jgi:hypothetical protein